MSNRIVRPVRAWAEYDQWLGYMEYRRQWLEWTWAEIPKSGLGELYSDKNEVNSVVEAVDAWSNERGFGALRSVRVLYENGYELRLWGVLGIDDLSKRVAWKWHLRHGKTEEADGQFTEDKDSEAVERAMIAAAAWFTQAEPIGS